MSTNYFLHINACACCNRGVTVLHLGKSAAGWRFAVQVKNNNDYFMNFQTFKEWIHFNNTKIYDEYGRIVPKDAFMSMIHDARFGRSMVTAQPPDMVNDCRIDGPVDLCFYEFS